MPLRKQQQPWHHNHRAPAQHLVVDCARMQQPSWTRSKQSHRLHAQPAAAPTHATRLPPPRPQGIVFLPLYMSTTAVRAVIPPNTNVLFGIYSQDTLPVTLFQGLQLTQRSAQQLLMGTLTSSCMEAAMNLRVDDLSVPNAGGAPVFSNAVGVDLSAAALSAVLRSAEAEGGSKPAIKGGMPPKSSTGGYQLTVDVGGYYFL